MGTNGWLEHAKLVLHEQERLDTCTKDNAREIHQMKIDLAVVKVKIALFCAFLGFVGGLVPTIFKLFF